MSQIYYSHVIYNFGAINALAGRQYYNYYNSYCITFDMIPAAIVLPANLNINLPSSLLS